MWNLPGPGIEPTYPAFVDRFLTTGPWGKSQGSFLRIEKDFWWEDHTTILNILESLWPIVSWNCFWVEKSQCPMSKACVFRNTVPLKIGEGNGNPLQYSFLENFMDREAGWATVHGVAKSQTRLSDFHTSLKNVVSWSFIFFLKLVSMTEGFSITLWISGWSRAPYSWLLYNVSENSVLSPSFEVYRISLRFCDRPGSGGEMGQIFPGSELSWAVFPHICWSGRSIESLDWPGLCSRGFLLIN